MDKPYRKQMRPGSHVFILEPDDAPTAQADGLKTDEEISEIAEKLQSSPEQSAVLQSLDPFWTRGIVDS
ncbi:MAG: hypothetical protein ACJ0J7_03525 [Tepidiformaceae bacterium]|tara:strand:+ start:1769 stop:1975 length:207 start_codon:yes stop_codon:yes gene_type:complete